MKKKYLLIVIGLFVVAFVFSKITGGIIQSNTPVFVKEKLTELKENVTLMDSIGGFKNFECRFNSNQYKNESKLEYSITIEGSERSLFYEGIQVKQQDGKWVLLDSKINIE